MGKQTSHFHKLKDKWEAKAELSRQGFLQNHSSKLIQAASKTAFKQLPSTILATLLVLTNPFIETNVAAKLALVSELSNTSSDEFSLNNIKKYLPENPRENLSLEQEVNVEAILSKSYGVQVKAELEGIKLNKTHALIGMEQHLKRFPGDTIDQHSINGDDQYLYEGIAPGLGSYGYWASSKDSLTDDMIEQEKWYLAVQTFLAPGFDQNVSKYYEFFRYKKMIVVNPNNQKAVVAVIGDAGPADWTGKNLGGSPEVMHHLNYHRGGKKGEVLYFFVEDPENKIPLGPIEPI